MSKKTVNFVGGIGHGRTCMGSLGYGQPHRVSGLRYTNNTNFDACIRRIELQVNGIRMEMIYGKSLKLMRYLYMEEDELCIPFSLLLNPTTVFDYDTDVSILIDLETANDTNGNINNFGLEYVLDETEQVNEQEIDYMQTQYCVDNCSFENRYRLPFNHKSYHIAIGVFDRTTEVYENPECIHSVELKIDGEDCIDFEGKFVYDKYLVIPIIDEGGNYGKNFSTVDNIELWTKMVHGTDTTNKNCEIIVVNKNTVLHMQGQWAIKWLS